jgi:hypothetical protein
MLNTGAAAAPGCHRTSGVAGSPNTRQDGAGSHGKGLVLTPAVTAPAAIAAAVAVLLPAAPPK